MFVVILGLVNDNVLNYKIILSTGGVRSNPADNHYKSMVMSALFKLVGGNGLHYVGYRVLNENPFTFEVKWQNCSLPTDCNNKDVTSVNSIISNAGKLDELSIKKYFPPEISIISLENKCLNKPPVVSGPLNLTIPVCGLYKFKLDPDIAIDSKGDKMNSMKVRLTQHDNTPLPINSWIRLDDKTKEIYAFPTEDVVSLNRTKKYLLSFEDSRGLNSAIFVYVSVVQNQKSYYELSIVFRSLYPKTTSYMDIQIKLLSLISSFTKRNTSLQKYRVMSFTKPNGLFYFRYGDCSVKYSLCKDDEKKLLDIEATMKTRHNELTSDFYFYLQKYFLGSSIRRETPVLSVDEAPINTHPLELVVLSGCQVTCIDFIHVFFDNDDVNKLNYTLEHMDGREVSRSYWIQIVDKEICVYPWRNVTVGVYKTTLTVTDKCGSQASTAVTVRIQTTHKQRFGFKWTLSSNTIFNEQISDVHYLNLAYQKMIKYLIKKVVYKKSSLLVVSYERKNSIFKVMFGLCSISYFPCDQTAVTQMSNALYVIKNIVSPELKDIFKPQFNVTAIEVNSCSTPQGAPTCRTKLVVNTTICSATKFQIPIDTCSDTKDGNTRKLKLSLFTDAYSSLSQSSWIQFNKDTQTIYGYPQYSSKESMLNNRYNYVIRARNSNGVDALISVSIYVLGDPPNLDYQVTLSGILNDNTSSDVENELCMIKQIGNYLNDFRINNVRMIRKDNRLVDFTWSYCNVSQTCDCSIVKTSQALLNNNKKNFQDVMEPCIILQSTRYDLYGGCRATKIPQLHNGISEVRIEVGKTYETILPTDQFVDAEDGLNENLTLKIGDASGHVITIDWMTIYKNRICGLLSHVDSTKYGFTNQMTIPYKVVAIDSCGKENVDTYNVVFTNTFPDLLYRVKLTFRLRYESVIGNCSILQDILYNIARYADIQKSDILVEEVSKINGTVNGTYFVWGIKKFTGTDCDKEEFQIFREKFFKNDQRSVVFTECMNKNGFEITDVQDTVYSKCYPVRWWIIILIVLLFFFLIFVLWLLWYLVPRCCSTWCSTAIPCCNSCCTAGGKCSSKSKNRADIDKVDTKPLPQPDPKPCSTNKPTDDSLPNHTDVKPASKPTKPIPLSPIDVKPEPIPPKSMVLPLDEIEPMPFPPNEIKPMPLPPEENKHMPLPPIYDLQLPQISDPHSESALYFHTDQQPSYLRHERRHTLGDDSYNHVTDKYSYERTDGYHGNDGYKGNDGYGYKGNEYVKNVSYRQQDHGRFPKEYHDKHNDNFNKTLRHEDEQMRHVRVKQPVALRIRRSELEEYIRRRHDKKWSDNISLDASDVENLMKGHAKLLIGHDKEAYRQQHRTNSRLADALTDRSVVYSDYIENRLRDRRRSLSTSSLSDLVIVDQYGRNTAIDPRNVKLKFDTNGASYYAPSQKKYRNYRTGNINDGEHDKIYYTEFSSSGISTAPPEGITFKDISYSKRGYQISRDSETRRKKRPVGSNNYTNRGFYDDSYV